MAFPNGMKTSKQWDAILVGDLFIDLIMTGFPTMPRLGEEGFASACSRETGGGAASTACGLSALGLKTALLAIAGADEVAWCRQRFAARGVDTSLLIADPALATAITVAVSTPEDRIFYTYYGPNAQLPAVLGQRQTWELLATGRHVHFAMPVEPQLLSELAAWLRERQTSTSIDVGWQEAWLSGTSSIPALAHVDWFLPNEHEAERMTGESDPRRMLDWFHQQSARGVAIKLGPQGSTSSALSEFRIIPSIPVTPIDTTGAGDCFNAGFLYGVLNGTPIEDSLQLGNLCGALSTEAPGGIAGFPSWDRLRIFLGRRWG
jgi:sugar/nucleoside kinase (ribokinase family)